MLGHGDAAAYVTALDRRAGRVDERDGLAAARQAARGEREVRRLAGHGWKTAVLLLPTKYVCDGMIVPAGKHADGTVAALSG